MSRPPARGPRFVVLALALLVAARRAHSRCRRPARCRERRDKPGLRRRRQLRRDIPAGLHRALQPGGSPASLAAGSVQYASASGTGSFGANSGLITELRASPSPPASTSSSRRLRDRRHHEPARADVIDVSPINMSGTGGKVALVRTTPRSAATGLDAVLPRRPRADRGPPRLGRRQLLRGKRPRSGDHEHDRRPPGGRRVHRHRQQRGRLHDGSAPSAQQRVTGQRLRGPTSPTGWARRIRLDTGGGTVTLAVSVTPGQSPLSTGLAVAREPRVDRGSPYSRSSTTAPTATSSRTTSSSRPRTVSPGTPAGSKTLPVTIVDARAARAARRSVLAVEPPLVAIHEIQGPGTVSPHAASSSPRPAS